MYNFTNFYIDGAWVAPLKANPMQVINPATEQAVGTISIGSAADADRTTGRRAACAGTHPAQKATS